MPSEREIIDALWASITKLYGEVGASLTGLTLINFNPSRKIVVIRVLLAALPSVRASLPTVTAVAGSAASVHVIAVSGTLKALFSNF